MNAYRILIVHPDEAVRSQLQRILDEAGCIVRAFSSAASIGSSGIASDVVLAARESGVHCQDSTFVEILSADAPEPPTPLFVRTPIRPDEVVAVVRSAAYCEQARRSVEGVGERVDSILSLLPYISVRTDSEGRITGMNAVAELHAGRSAKGLVGQPFSKVFSLSNSRTGASAETPTALVASHEADYTLAEKGGNTPVRAHAAILRDNAGAVDSCYVILEDRSIQHDCAFRLRLLDAAVENIECSVFVALRKDGGNLLEIALCNTSFEKLTGWTRSEAVGSGISIIETVPRENYWDEMIASLREGSSWKGEGMVRCKSGQDFLGGWSASPILDASGVCVAYAFALRDQSHMRRMEESLRQSQKIESVGRLATGIAHDFNNLLSVINSYCDLQILKLEEGSPAMKYAQQIRAAGRKGVDLVSQLMTFSRKDRPNPTVLDLSQVIEEVKGMLRRVIREDIEMETNYGENLSRVRVDQGQIEQALLNLCVNARDAMPNGGRITIGVANRDYEHSLAREHDTIRQGRYVVLSINDTGCGMDEETQKRIFDPFFTTKEIGKGTGLGLATVHSIMKQYGGFVTVKSRPGEGSRFELIFPASDMTGSSGHASGDGDTAAPTGSEVTSPLARWCM
ncbi:MAG TPA: ATP-binding protein, partial [Opitutales bacterium]|nr:ATP-binding protein [Opitutales bacterium]